MNSLHCESQQLDHHECEGFWKARACKYGHTGWSDQFIYQFDQLCRMQTFTAWLHSSFATAGKALDFGCGSGDFSRLLVKLGWTVSGCDKYIRPKFVHPRFSFLNALPEWQSQPNSFDLIVSITVLDHIKSDQEFQACLEHLRRLLKPTGMFCFLEYSPDLFKAPSDYQAFRPMSTWRRCLQEAGLHLEKTESVFHPIDAPIPAWNAYQKHPYSRVYKKIRLRWISRMIPLWPLKAVAATCLQQHGRPTPTGSPLNMLTGRTF